MTKLEDLITGVIKNAGDLGITARQIAKKLDIKKETVSRYLWVLKKSGRVMNVHRDFGSKMIGGILTF